MKNKKKILIVTANDFLIYQPTILSLYDYLIKNYDVRIISFEPRFISRQKDERRNVKYIKIPDRIIFVVQNLDSIIFRGLKYLKNFFSPQISYTLYHKMQFKFLKAYLKGESATHVIAVDLPALHICQQVYGRCDFLSLEIQENDPYRNKVDATRIDAVLIQNTDRYKYLFGSLSIRTFIVQNAPVFIGPPKEGKIQEGLIWAGSILERFAVLDAVRFIKAYPEYKLTLKGGGEEKTINYIKQNHQEIIARGSLILDQEYIPGDQFIDYLAKFRIGLCFYSWDLIKESINYQTAPSGKVFMYLAAGIPVVACRIKGFDFIEQYQAGILVDDYEPATILNAVRSIEGNYQNMKAGCLRAAKYFSFDERIQPYLDYLENKK